MYISVNVVLAVMLILNIRKVDKLQGDVNALWQQIAIMAVAATGAFSKLEKKIDEKQTEE